MGSKPTLEASPQLSADALAQNLSHFDATHDEFGVGPSVGVFLPTDTKIQSIFGSSIFKFGVSLGPAPKLSADKFGPSLAVVDVSNGGQHVTVLAGMVSYNLAIPSPSKRFLPYVKLGVGGSYADYSFNYGVNHYSAKKILPVVQAEAGIVFERNWELSAAYDWIGSTDGFNFSGLSISLTYTVFRF